MPIIEMTIDRYDAVISLIRQTPGVAVREIVADGIPLYQDSLRPITELSEMTAFRVQYRRMLHPFDESDEAVTARREPGAKRE